MDLKLLSNKELDYNKWNRLVERYSEGLPYAYSRYLDAVCSEWFAYVWGDYKAGFPLQINYKWGLSYSLQPFLTQQVGFLGKNEFVFDAILEDIDQKVFYYYQLFFFNVTHQAQVELRFNYELQLSSDYQIIKKGFNNNTKRNIKQSEQFENNIIVSEHCTYQDICFIFENSLVVYNGMKKSKIKQLLHNAEKNQALKIYKSVLNNETVSINVYIMNAKRAVYLLSVQNKLGKQIKANFALVNQFIKEHCDTSLILDFEAFDIEGVVRFFKGFGAKKLTYQSIRNKSLKKGYKKNLFLRLIHQKKTLNNVNLG